jgi:hypothetical protein
VAGQFEAHRAHRGAVAYRMLGSASDDAVASQAATFSQSALSNQVVAVSGSIGIVTRRPDGRLRHISSPHRAE